MAVGTRSDAADVLHKNNEGGQLHGVNARVCASVGKECRTFGAQRASEIESSAST